MKRIIWTIVLMFVLIAPCAALAGPMGADTVDYTYYRIMTTLTAADTAGLRPDINGDVWPAGYIKGLPPASLSLPAGQFLVLGIGNWQVDKNTKQLDVHIACPVLPALDLAFRHFGYRQTPSIVPGDIFVQANAGLAYDLHWDIDPQPQWEWMAIKNTAASAITLNSVSWSRYCDPKIRPVPSLTTWGILSLLLLLGGTAVWLIRKRKPAVSM
jgi:hypothetical protein